MVIGLLLLTAIPSVTGICQAISAQKTHDQREKDERRMEKFGVSICYNGSDARGKEIDKSRLVARNGAVWMEIPSKHKSAHGDVRAGYPLEAFYIEYPDNAVRTPNDSSVRTLTPQQRVPIVMGLVSQVQDTPPLLNWIYVDRHTLEVRYGNKSSSIEHHVGSWDWTEDEQNVTLEQQTGSQSPMFLAVARPGADQWQLYFDHNQDSLYERFPADWVVIPVSLRRDLR